MSEWAIITEANIVHMNKSNEIIKPQKYIYIGGGSGTGTGYQRFKIDPRNITNLTIEVYNTTYTNHGTIYRPYFKVEKSDGTALGTASLVTYEERKMFTYVPIDQCVQSDGYIHCWWTAVSEYQIYWTTFWTFKEPPFIGKLSVVKTM